MLNEKKHYLSFGISFFLLSSSVFATNWALLRQFHRLGATESDYIDSDTVIQNGNSLTFWELKNIVWPSRVDTFLSKIEVTLTDPRQYRELEEYRYKNSQQLGQGHTVPTKFYDASKIKDDLDLALKYAKEGQDAGQKPNINEVPPQGTKETQDTSQKPALDRTANWVYISHSPSLNDNPPFKDYIAGGTVSKSDNTLIYWVLFIYDKIDKSGAMKNLEKIEVKLTNPRTSRILEIYAYDSKDQELSQAATPGQWLDVSTGSVIDKEIDAALRYAK